MAKDRKNPHAIRGARGGAAVKALANLHAPVIKVGVTRQIIDTACRANSGHCLISDAVQLAAPWARHIASDLQSIRSTDPEKGLRYTYLTPRHAQYALIDYDKGINPKPFEFSLRGAHIATSYKRVTLATGEKKQKAVHKLGRRRFAALPGQRGGKGNRTIPDTIGGKPFPQLRMPSSTFRREYGMRAFTKDFDLDKLSDAKMPIGAPSLSDQ